jgi:hypothetical protein
LTALQQVIAIDGKTSRRTTSKAAAAPLHMVSAFAAEPGLVLGQTATDQKSNELTPPCVRLIVTPIESKPGGDDERATWRDADKHSKIEQWCVCYRRSAQGWMPWRELKSFSLVEHTRIIGDKTSVERRYYISSTAPEAEKFMRAAAMAPTT